MGRKAKSPVTSHAAKEIDEMMVGFYFPHEKKEKTPYDFISDPVTGIRPSSEKKPWGVRRVDLRSGIPTTANIPSLEIWKTGAYVWDLEKGIDLPDALELMSEQEAWESWVVDGEGMPGNFEWSVYRLPTEIVGEPNPKHPAMWPEKLRKAVTFTYKPSVGSPPAAKPTTASSIKTTQAPSLPAGVRVRCQGCGHWFKEDSLAGHAVCCPVLTGNNDSDWAVMCADACGCQTLDEVSTPKAGFPRPKPVPEKKEGGEQLSATEQEQPEEEVPTEEESSGEPDPGTKSSES